MTYKEFYQWASELSSRFENRGLETYLSALYLQVEKHEPHELSAEGLLTILEKSLTSEAIEFNPEWLKITSPPELDTTLPDNLALSEGITFTMDVIKFQMSELNKMRGKQLKNDRSYFGVDSETDNRWYNFDPFTNLECGSAWFLDGSKNEDEEMKVNWQTLGILLEMGRKYE